MNKKTLIMIPLIIVILTIVGCTKAGTQPGNISNSSGEPGGSQVSGTGGSKDVPAQQTTDVEQTQEESTQVVEVSVLLNNPDSYRGQMVTLTGIVTNACAGDG